MSYKHAIEIVIHRDPDGDTSLTYFCNGRQIEAAEVGITEYHIDPGRSGADSEWQKSMEEDAAQASPVAAETIRSVVELYF